MGKIKRELFPVNISSRPVENQFFQAGKSPYLRSNTSVHATKAVEILNASTISVYLLLRYPRMIPCLVL